MIKSHFWLGQRNLEMIHFFYFLHRYQAMGLWILWVFFNVCHLSRISSSCRIQTHQRKKLLLRSMQFQQCRKGPFAKVPSINDVATCMTPTLPWLFFFYLLRLDNLLKTTWFLIKFKYSEKAIKIWRNLQILLEITTTVRSLSEENTLHCTTVRDIKNWNHKFTNLKCCGMEIKG